MREIPVMPFSVPNLRIAGGHPERGRRPTTPFSGDPDSWLRGRAPVADEMTIFGLFNFSVS